MKARLLRDDLTTALAAVKPAVTSRRPFVRLRTEDTGLEVTADDLNVGITARIASWHPMGKDTDGEIVVPYRKLQEFVANCGGEHVEVVVLKKDPGKVTVGQSKIRMEMALATAAEWPRRPEPDPSEGGIEAVLDGAQWASVQALAPFASTDPAHGVRTGVNFLPDLVIASDGFILGIVRVNFGFTVAIPAGVVAAVGTNAEEVRLTADDRSMRLEADGVTVITSRLGGDFGDGFRQFTELPTVAEMTVHVDELKAATAIARIPARTGIGGGKDMVLRFADDKAVHVESWPTDESPDIARCPLDATVKGEPFDISFQERWLEAPLKLVGTDDDGLVTMRLTEYLKPLYMERGDNFALMMPLRPPAAEG